MQRNYAETKYQKRKWRLDIQTPLSIELFSCIDRLNLFRADLWTPLVKTMLIAVDNVSHNHTGDGKDQNADEDLVCLECGACHGNHKANTCRRRIKLTDHDTDERASNR